MHFDVKKTQKHSFQNIYWYLKMVEKKRRKKDSHCRKNKLDYMSTVVTGGGFGISDCHGSKVCRFLNLLLLLFCLFPFSYYFCLFVFVFIELFLFLLLFNLFLDAVW